MKKIISFISFFLLLSAAAVAEITAKKTADGKLEVTFFYGNPRAEQVLLAADFTNFKDGALPMTKTDKGFTLTQIFEPGASVKYKFIVDDNWTTDLRAPDFVDDGFGGKNSFAELDSLVADAGGADKVKDSAAAPAKDSAKLQFSTWTVFGFQQKWDTVKTNDKKESSYAFDPNSAGLNLKSYWKFSGKVLPMVPVFVEIAVAEKEDFKNIYERGKLSVGEGMKRLFIDNLFDPIAFYNGEGVTPEKTYLGHFKTGVTTKYVEWTTGYKYAKLPKHQNVNWLTVDGGWDAGYAAVGGYNEFKTGVALNEWLSSVTNDALKLEAVFAPNRSADRAGNQYGMYGYLNATILGNHYVDFQYNTALGETYDKIFDTVLEQDFILGYKGAFGPVTLKANGLYNLYGSKKTEDNKKTYYVPGSSDVGPVNENPKNKIDSAAMNTNITFANSMITATLGYRFRGAQANMMYVKQDGNDTHISDQLGKTNTQRIFATVKVKATNALSIELKPWVQMNLMKDSALKQYKNDKDAIELSISPKVIYKISDAMTVDAGGEVKYITTEKEKYQLGDKKESFILNKAGVHFNTKLDGAVSYLDIVYGYKKFTDDHGLHNLLAAVGLPAEVELQAGIGVLQNYSGTKEFTKSGKPPVGFSLGAHKNINKKHKTILSGAFVYNMDPYKGFGDGWHNFSLSGYNLSKDEKTDIWTQAAAFRVGVNLDF